MALPFIALWEVCFERLCKAKPWVTQQEVTSERRNLRLKEHDDVIKWKHFPRNWPFVRWIHRSPMNVPHKGQWRGALMFSSICAWTNGWANNRDAGDLRRHCAHYDVTVMTFKNFWTCFNQGSNMIMKLCVVKIICDNDNFWHMNDKKYISQ